jgi:hypothetical protein
VVKPDTQQVQRLQSLRTTAVPVLRQMQSYLEQIYGDNGLFANMSVGERTNVLKLSAEQLSQRYPVIDKARRYYQQNAPLLARSIEEMRGNVAFRLVDRMEGGLPILEAGLTFTKQFPFVAFSMPDSRGAALRHMQATIDTVDGMAAELMEKPGFQFPGFKRYTFAEDREAAERRPGAATTSQSATPLVPASPQPGQGERVAQRAVQSQGPGTPKELGTPAPTAKAIPQDQRAVNATLQTMQITQAPDPRRDPQAFQTFLTTLRQQLTRYRPSATPQQLDGYIDDLARRMGTTWQR